MKFSHSISWKGLKISSDWMRTHFLSIGHMLASLYFPHYTLGQCCLLLLSCLHSFQCQLFTYLPASYILYHMQVIFFHTINLDNVVSPQQWTSLLPLLSKPGYLHSRKQVLFCTTCKFFSSSKFYFASKVVKKCRFFAVHRNILPRRQSCQSK